MRSQRSGVPKKIVLAELLLTCTLSTLAQAQQKNCSPVDGFWFPYMFSLRISSISISSDTVDQDTLDQAASMWNGTCAVDDNKNHPKILTNQSSEALINVILHNGSTDTSICGAEARGCGCTDIMIDTATGELTTGNIHLFETQANGVDCSPYRIESIAHEIGHNLGLKNVPSGCLDDCSGSIMGRPGGRMVRPEDCGVVDFIWNVPQEPTDAGEGDIGPCF